MHGLHRRARVAVALLALACGPDGSTAPPSTEQMPTPAEQSQAVPPEPPGVQLTVGVPGDASQSFSIRPKACEVGADESGCPFEILLIDRGREVARGELRWVPAFAPVAIGPVELDPGVGDPLAPDATSELVNAALLTGEELRAAATVARPVSLRSGDVGLLVDQVAGFEHTKRAHFVYARRGDALVEVWRYEEGSGPTWSTTAIVGSPPTQRVMMIEGATLSEALGDSADIVETEVVEWSDEAGAVVSVAGGSAVAAAVVGPFPTIAAALALREQHVDCLLPFWLIPADQLALEDTAGYAFAVLGASREGAESTLAASRACIGDVPARVASLAAGPSEKSDP